MLDDKSCSNYLDKNVYDMIYSCKNIRPKFINLTLLELIYWLNMVDFGQIFLLFITQNLDNLLNNQFIFHAYYNKENKDLFNFLVVGLCIHT